MKMLRFLVLHALIVLSMTAAGALDERIRVVLEEPTQGGRYSDISNLRGWAVSPEGMGVQDFSVYIDGDFRFYIPVGGNRPDVGSAYPLYPNSEKSGYSMAFNYKELSPGEHTITIRAFDNLGNFNEATTSFFSERFVTPFIADKSQVDLNTIENIYVHEGQALLLNGARIEGRSWDFLLRWNVASQSFKIEKIEPSGQNLLSTSAASSDSNQEATSSDSGDTTHSGSTASAGDTSVETGSSSGYEPIQLSSTGFDSGSTASEDSSGDTSDANAEGDQANAAVSSDYVDTTAPSERRYASRENACVTTASRDVTADLATVMMSNGLEAVNEGREWSQSEQQVVFKTAGDDWYTIEAERELIFLEVLTPPETCQPWIYQVIDAEEIRADVKALIFRPDGEAIVPVDCDISANTPWGVIQASPPTYLVNLNTARQCEILDFFFY